MRTVMIDGIEYVEKPSQMAESDAGPYVIARCRDAGVHAGYLEAHPEGTREATLSRARRLWRWNSTSTLTGLANDGPVRPGDCRFSAPSAGKIVLLDVCELIECTEVARESIEEVAVWVAK